MRSAAARRARRPLLALLAVYGIAVLLIMVRAGSPADPMWWVTMIPFLAWAIAPLAAAVFIISRQDRPFIITLSMMLMGFVIVSGTYLYLESLFGPASGSTSALVFVFLPIYQWALPLLILLLVASARIAGRYRNQAQTSE